ncbi:uncharacterized protein METZ01_LOCUS457631, partial [marine metagenome]
MRDGKYDEINKKKTPDIVKTIREFMKLMLNSLNYGF